MHNTKKILLHSNYNPFNHGGIESVVKMIASILGGFKCHTTCFFGSTENKSEIITKKLTLNSKKINLKIGGACLLQRGNISFLAEARKSDLIIFQEPYPTLWPALFFIRRILKKRVIVIIHAAPSASKSIMWIYSKIRSFILSGSICVTTSPNLLSQVRSIKYKRNEFIPLCAPSISISEIDNKTLTLPSRYVLYVGRLAKYKGINEIIKSAHECRNINFVIAGSGPLADYIHNEIQKKKLCNVTFVNKFLTEEEKNHLIKRSEFLLFPSTSENEAFGIIQLEAMQLEKAIINTHLNSGVNYVAPNNVCAITVEKNNVAELTKSIKKLWEDNQLSINLGKNGKIRFNENFTEELFIKSWGELLENNGIKRC